MIKFSEPVIDNKEINSVTKTLKSVNFQGSIVETFEKNFSRIHNIYSLSTSNCTTALHLVLKSLNIEKGDSNLHKFNIYCSCKYDWITGAKLILVDINKNNFSMNIDDLKKDYKN